MSMLGRFGSWLSKTQAFGSLLAPRFHKTAEKLKHVAAVAQARAVEAVEEAAAQGRVTPGAFGGWRQRVGRPGRLARRCAAGGKVRGY